ncbi:MAG: glutathione synthase [Neisseria sp.]|nr:glutathione synthase [Neisseria sp.]
MNILFIADPLAGFKTYKDTTYAMMREMAARGWSLSHTLSDQLSVQNGTVFAHASAVRFAAAPSSDRAVWYKPWTWGGAEGTPPSGGDWFVAGESVQAALSTFDAVIMRTDPPFDLQYLYATQLLTLAEAQGARVFNSGQAMRDFNEKLAILNFSEWIAPTVVTTRAQTVRDFLAEQGDIIIKPLDGMGGAGIFRLTAQDPNIGSILETLMRLDTRTIMAQRYIPEISAGDKRVLVIGGEVIPYALARIPQQGETRGNLAAGGRGVAQPLSARDREIAENLAPELQRRGILLAGLDIIGDYLTEVNVTSPTGFQEIAAQTDCDVAAVFVDALQAACNA